MKNSIDKWFGMVERLRYAERIWKEEELPVEIIQTHISVILLGKHRVLKLKKPVDFGFLDYTTLAKRRLACESEIELNRRLCPDIYLGTQAIVEDESGFHLSQEGNIIEYGVLMKRLPEELMLDRMVADNTITEAMIVQIAEKLIKFHQNARRGADVDHFGSLETIRYNWEENFEQTKPYLNRTISEDDFELIRAWIYRWLKENENLLNTRVEQGHICDGHGDLRCESICISDSICIFDCIEFNERFRCADVANEAAFLAMDLVAYGRPDLGYFFYERYAQIAGDEQLFKLYSFYRCYRAFIRGKVLSFQLDEKEISEEKHRSAKEKAKNYFMIASDFARQLQMPTIIMVGGLSGTGKTSVARGLAGELGLRVVSSDAVRKSLFGDDKKESDYGKGKYDEESNLLTYQKMIEKGVELLEKDGGVILDATFCNAADRELIKQRAESIGAICRFVECRLSSEIVHQRLKLRAEKKDGLSDANWQIYQHQKADFESIVMSNNTHFIIDTENNLLSNCRLAANWLRTSCGQNERKKNMQI
jgi:hypothetical protein